MYTADAFRNLDPPFFGDNPADSFVRKLSPVETKHLPETVKEVLPLLKITARDYDACIDGRWTIDCEGIVERILRRQRRPPKADVKLYDLHDILVRQEDYETIAYRLQSCLALHRQMEERMARMERTKRRAA